MLCKVRFQQVSSAVLLTLCALQSITPDIHDLASNTLLSVILQTSAADFPIDDESPDDVCGPAWARRATLDFQNHAVPRHNQAALPTIAANPANARLFGHSLPIHQSAHTAHLHRLCRLNC